VTTPSPTSPAGDFNAVLSETIDLLEEVKQADWKVPANHPLHGELDRLRDDLDRWNAMLAERDHHFGLSALSFMPSLIVRTPTNLWKGDPTDGEVGALVDDHLRRLATHAALVRPELNDEHSRQVFEDLERGIDLHRKVLSQIVAGSSPSI
jgi:DNA-binding ferritin-like protein